MPLLLLRYDGCTDGWESEFNQENRCDKVDKYEYLQTPVCKSTDNG